VQLTASGEFEEALALCKLLPPEDSNLRAAKESSIHIRYAQIFQLKRNVTIILVWNLVTEGTFELSSTPVPNYSSFWLF